MIRTALLVAVFASAAVSARAQGVGTGQDIWSGSASGLQSGFQGSVSSSFGKPSPPAAEVPPADATLALGGTGQLGPSALAGQPSNFLPSVTVTAPFGGPMTYENGPAGPLTYENGPAGPID